MGDGESGEDGVVALIVMLVEVAVLLVMVTAVVVTVERVMALVTGGTADYSNIMVMVTVIIGWWR